jgi:hypothetical protein
MGIGFVVAVSLLFLMFLLFLYMKRQENKLMAVLQSEVPAFHNAD